MQKLKMANIILLPPVFPTTTCFCSWEWTRTWVFLLLVQHCAHTCIMLALRILCQDLLCFQSNNSLQHHAWATSWFSAEAGCLVEAGEYVGLLSVSHVSGLNGWNSKTLCHMCRAGKHSAVLMLLFIFCSCKESSNQKWAILYNATPICF